MRRIAERVLFANVDSRAFVEQVSLGSSGTERRQLKDSLFGKTLLSSRIPHSDVVQFLALLTLAQLVPDL